MAFGNRLGVAVDSSVSEEELFAPAYGCIVAEVKADKLSDNKTYMFWDVPSMTRSDYLPNTKEYETDKKM